MCKLNQVNQSLSIFERIVVESLEKGNKKLSALSNDTGIKEVVLNNILILLEKKNIILKLNSSFSLNREEMKIWLDKISSTSSIKNELKEIFELVVSSYKREENLQTNNQLRLQKVFMTIDEEQIYKQRLEELESFMREVRRNRIHDKEESSIKKQKVIFWGSVDYQYLIDEALA